MSSHLTCFLEIDSQSDFTIHNLPYGIFSETPQGTKRVGVAIGDWVIDLAHLEAHGLLAINGHQDCFNQATLNKFIETGKHNWQKVRTTLQSLLSAENPTLRDDVVLRQNALFKQNTVTLHLPIQVSGYTDFYSSKEHATNVGTMFRDPKNALLPNWSELPVGYNGRASSVIVSGKDIVRTFWANQIT